MLTNPLTPILAIFMLRDAVEDIVWRKYNQAEYRSFEVPPGTFVYFIFHPNDEPERVDQILPPYIDLSFVEEVSLRIYQIALQDGLIQVDYFLNIGFSDSAPLVLYCENNLIDQVVSPAAPVDNFLPIR